MSPPSKTTAMARRRTRRSNRGYWPPFELPELDQRQRDVIGLGLVAFAALLACVFYLGWAGGRVGEAMADGILFLFGGVGYTAPIVLFAIGAALVVRPVLPATHPLKTGALCLAAALMLGLAAGTLGLGPGDTPRDGFLDPNYLEHHGGLVGELLFWGSSKLFSEAGSHILCVFLLLAGVLLVTGASLAGIMSATGNAAITTTERVRRTAHTFGPQTALRPARESARVRPPEPEDEEPVVRATHVEAPALDASERYPDVLGEHPQEPAPAEAPAPGEEQPEEQEPDPVTEDEPEGAALTPMGNRRSPVTESEDLDYRLPNPSFLKRSNGAQKLDAKGIERVGAQLVEALSHFSVEARVLGTVTGPHVTRYELRLAPGIKMSKVAQLKDDLAYALAAEQVRILAPIPGKQAVGVEVPNRVRKTVHLGDVFQEAPHGWSPLSVWLGKDIAGKAIGTDLAKQPHILIAGTTGSGKSGCVNAMLSSVLLRSSPNEVRMVLVDPKRVELNHYEGIPHLLTPVVTSPRLAANVLGNLLAEMEERYAVMSRVKTRSLPELNRVRAREGEPPLPYVLCVIDELADLMMVAPADVEDAVIRLAQKSRAVGIHLVLATQRPSADVITGMIKANVPARIAFAVSSQTDSRVILDQNGAESLLGQGDMLFRPAGESRSARIQGAFITEEEIERLTEEWRRQGEPELHEELLEAVDAEEDADGGDGDFDPDRDDLLGEAIATVVQMGTASTSMLQRRLRVGYTRAGRLIDMMERRGVISGYEGSKARQVLITEADLPRVLDQVSEPAVATSSDD
ncbi:MAG: DNA translocase FtsK 4TM domain-containing protein [Thermoleophilaceae bacterium]|nr:DNA translocase FtsK 4TM domain-containing protein [Thermoleophilaceae bacterium]